MPTPRAARARPARPAARRGRARSTPASGPAGGTSGLRRQLRETGLDALVEAAVHGADGGADAVLHGTAVAGPVADDGDALDAQQRKAAVFPVVQLLEEALERGLHEPAAELRAQVGQERALQPLAHHLRHALGALEDDVAYEAVAGDDIEAAVPDIAAFGVADEVEVHAPQALRRFQRDGRALGILLAHAQQAHLGG